MNTTVANAYVQPLFSRYVSQIQRGLAKRAVRGAALPDALQRRYHLGRDRGRESRSGWSSRGRRPVRSSAPSTASAIGAAEPDLVRHGRHDGQDLPDRGRPAGDGEHFEIARVHRFKKGSGLPVRVPSDRDWSRSAPGAAASPASTISGCSRSDRRARAPSPVPACYGFGGERPTVTDANLAPRLPQPRLLPRRPDEARLSARPSAAVEHGRRAARARSASRPPTASSRSSTRA